MLDVHMKRVYKFDNITLFADLSFAAFVFSVGRAVSLISVDLNSNFQQDILLNLFVFLFMLLLLWLANLYNCNNIVEVRSASSKGKHDELVVWLISATLAFLSTATLLIPQIIGII